MSDDTVPTRSAQSEAGVPAAEPKGPRFAEGELVANRYRIVRFLARGGMGEVYEALDLTLKERIALKTVVAEKADRLNTVERFKREILLARKITHRNVCRIFDVGFHVRDEEAVVFLTMELLEGETLAQRIRREGPLPPAEALAIAHQIAKALDAAHRADIVHRDLKSQNVLLVGDRVVVTDFGLARSATGDSAVTHEAVLLGSPAYMAPEQVEGRTATPAADIYAFGVVLFEMATASLPFVAETPLATATKRLTEDPPRPRDRVRALDARWDATILRCLERQPARRFAHASDVVYALEHDAARPWRPWAAIAAALGVALALGVYALVHSRRAPADVRPSVAVPNLRNLSGNADSDWLAVALAEMIDTELGVGDQVRVVPGDQVALSTQSESLGARFLVRGSYVVLEGGALRLDVALVEAGSGRTVASVRESGEREHLFDLVSRVGADLRHALGVRERQPGEADAARSSFPANPEAARLYAEGLDHWRHFDLSGARAKLEQAIQLEPGFPLTYAALSEVLEALDEQPRSVEMAQRASDLAGHLPRQERLWISAHLASARHQWEEAVRIYRALALFYPDDIEATLALAHAQTEADHSDDALATLSSLPREPRVDLELADAALRRHDYPRSLEAAKRAETGALATGQRHLAASAMQIETRALRERGDFQQAIEVGNRARALSAEVGDHAAEGRTLVDISVSARHQGDLAQAQTAAQTAYEIFEGVGDRVDASHALLNVANVHYVRGELKKALEGYDRTAAIDAEVGFLPNEVGAHENAASALFLLGEFTAARRRFERAIALSQKLEHSFDEPTIRLALAEVLRATGNLAGAEEQAKQGIDRARALGSTDTDLQVLIMRGTLAIERDDLAQARRVLEDGRAIGERNHDQENLVQLRLQLVRVDLVEGALAHATKEARALADETHAAGMHDQEISAQAILSRALLAAGDRAGAQAAVAKVAELCGNTENWNARFELVQSRARAEGSAEARKALQAAIADAERRGGRGLALEGRLVLAEIEHRPSAQLAADAQELGFKLIARRARKP